MRSAIVGIAGPVLADEERALFRELPPAAIILFARNVVDPVQLAALTASIGALVAIDQEGGRVARLRPPHWRAHKPAAEQPCDRAAWLTGALIGADCAAAGIRLVCAPVLDLAVPGATAAIGDRAYSANPAVVATRGLAFAAGLARSGCIAVGKHAPGHGHAQADSHHDLPRIAAGVDLAADLAAFRACAGLPWMMTSHIVYERWDRDRPATWSPTVIQDVIRGEIGFEGVLVSDDLAMHALHGPAGERAARALAAGIDVAMHCSGVLAETEAVLRACPPVSAAIRERMVPPHASAGDAMAWAQEREGRFA